MTPLVDSTAHRAPRASAPPAVAPIVLGNSPSAGSSLLRVLLGRLPGIASAGEIGLLDKPGLFALPARRWRRTVHRMLRRDEPGSLLAPSRLFAQLDGWGVERDELPALVDAARDHADLARRFFKLARTRSGAHRWMEKTPGNVFAFAAIRAALPDALLVHIVRDGRDATSSLVRRGMSPFLAVSRWYWSTLCGIRHRDDTGYVELRYEDLVRDPEATLRNLCARLGEPWTPRLLEPDEGIDHKDPSWRNDHNAPPSDSSIGTHRRDATDALRAVFARVRPSRRGRAALPCAAPGERLPTPDELQVQLGYAPFDAAPPLPPGARRDARRLARRDAWRARLRPGAGLPWPTRLAVSPEDPA